MGKSLCACAVVVACVVGLAWADQGEHEAGEKSRDGRPAMLKEKLGLTDVKAKQVLSITEDFRKRVTALREKVGGEIASVKRAEEVKRLREDRDTRLKAVLTAKQYGRLQELMAHQVRDHRDKDPAGAPPRAADSQERIKEH